jgi:tetratricopeptide (TPR) repeat protein
MKKLLLLIQIVVFLCISSVSSQTRKIEVENANIYFSQRNIALQFVKNKEWKKAISILVNLTDLYNDDGDLFYLLGLSYYEVSNYKKAIEALIKSLDAGGTILTGIPTGSSPSNDIMIKIAKAYANEGNKKKTIEWLQKGFALRYDGKPFLTKSVAFKDYLEDESFQKTLGIYTDKNTSRIDAWNKDISYLQKCIEQLHYNPFHSISKVEFEKQFINIKEIISSSTDQQIIVSLMKIIGRLGNGHNLIIPTSSQKSILKKLPVQFYSFNDGMYIVNAEKGFEKYIGHKVETIGNMTIENALKKTNVVNARDNDMQTLWLGPYYLRLPDVLKGLGIIDNEKLVNLTLKNDKGNLSKIILKPINWKFNRFPSMPKIQREIQPLFLSKQDNRYWYRVMTDINTVYIQFNSVRDKKEESLKAFNKKLRKQIAKNKTKNLILDLRHNHGGDGSLLPPMLKTIINFEVMNPEGKIFVIMGRGTFSAAQNLLTDITKYTNAILVGEPSGSKPNHIGEAGWFKLPHSGLMGLISTQFHQSSNAEDLRKWIAPQIPVNLSSLDYFNGNDKVLNTIIEVINDNKKLNN